MMTFRPRLQRMKTQGNAMIKFSLEKLKDPSIADNFRATIGGKFAQPLVLDNQDTEIDDLINSFRTAVTETANNILGKHRPAKKPWVTDNILKLCNKRRQLKQKNTAEGAKLYWGANQQIKKGTRKAKHTWIEEQCQGIEETLPPPPSPPPQKQQQQQQQQTTPTTTTRKSTTLWKNWQARNKGELLPSRTKQGNVSQNTIFKRGGQSTVPNCIHTQQ